MGGQVRIRCRNAIRLIVPAISAESSDAARRLDALETLIFNEPDPEIRIAYVRRFNEIWEDIAG